MHDPDTHDLITRLQRLTLALTDLGNLNTEEAQAVYLVQYVVPHLERHDHPADFWLSQGNELLAHLAHTYASALGRRLGHTEGHTP